MNLPHQRYIPTPPEVFDALTAGEMMALIEKGADCPFDPQVMADAFLGEWLTGQAWMRWDAKKKQHTRGLN